MTNKETLTVLWAVTTHTLFFIFDITTVMADVDANNEATETMVLIG